MASSCSGDGGPPVPSATTWSPYEGPGLILYADTMNGSIVAVDVDHAQQWRLKFDNLEEFPAAIECSRDGAHAAYLTHDPQTREGIVRITDETGERVLRLEGVVSGMSWSPDAKYVAVTRIDFETLINELLLIDADNGEQQSLISGSGTIGAPRWSPDGSSITFDSAVPEHRNRLYRYTLGSDASAAIPMTIEGASSPDWSPATNAIVFVAPPESGPAQLFTISPDGGEAAQITATNTDKTYPRWSLDGSLVAYVGTIPEPLSSRKLAALRHNVAVWTATPDGKDEKAFTDVALDAWLIGWCAPGPWLDEGWKGE